ncbi:TPA: hypothetical protein MCO68_000097 [Klebsiella pneumoniae]|nr:hypothetical protein [Klebsiella pneumoniae]
MFPAPAGINRSAVTALASGACVPRASGDKPDDPEFLATRELCSPRQRG